MAGRLGQALEPFRDLGPLGLRIAIGEIFMAHGAQKLFG